MRASDEQVVLAQQEVRVRQRELDEVMMMTRAVLSEVERRTAVLTEATNALTRLLNTREAA